MRSKALKLFGSIALLGATTLPVSAAPVTLHYTGDNDVVAWWVVSAHGQPTLSAGDIVASDLNSKSTDWTSSASSAPIDLAPGQYGVFFEVRNTSTDHNGADSPPSSQAEGNPAGFIASIEGATGVGNFTTYTFQPGWLFIDTTNGSAIGSNENDLVFTYNGSPGATSPFVLAQNGGGIWGTIVPAFSDIDANAWWIWGNTTPNPDTGAPIQATRGIFYTVVEVAPVPIPAAAWLLGSATLGLAGFGRRKSLPI